MKTDNRYPVDFTVLCIRCCRQTKWDWVWSKTAQLYYLKCPCGGKAYFSGTKIMK